MTTFITNLMESIFTPGPTPTLLIATNVAFAFLQLTLLLLLIATYSIHFLVLSTISAGLWLSINWFVAELNAAQTVEDERKRAEESAAAGEDTETEAETVIEAQGGGSASKEVEVLEVVGEVKDRRAAGRVSAGSRSEISTEDEWERVSEEENEKDK